MIELAIEELKWATPHGFSSSLTEQTENFGVILVQPLTVYLWWKSSNFCVLVLILKGRKGDPEVKGDLKVMSTDYINLYPYLKNYNMFNETNRDIWILNTELVLNKKLWICRWDHTIAFFLKSSFRDTY